jgi:hypothetical protein
VVKWEVIVVGQYSASPGRQPVNKPIVETHVTTNKYRMLHTRKEHIKNEIRHGLTHKMYKHPPIVMVAWSPFFI